MTGLAAYPFTAFNFAVEISVAGGPVLCGGSFSECDGVEMSQELKTIREGGNNGVQVRLAGPTVYGNLTLKRGMSSDFHLWDWFEAAVVDPSLRANAEVVLYRPDGDTASPRARVVLQGCRPLKLKAAALNAKDGMVAVEEMQVAYQSLKLVPGEEAGGA
jgi:phage tail-like protein